MKHRDLDRSTDGLIYLLNAKSDYFMNGIVKRLRPKSLRGNQVKDEVRLSEVSSTSAST
jgi:hypothetical protein